MGKAISLSLISVYRPHGRNDDCHYQFLVKLTVFVIKYYSDSSGKNILLHTEQKQSFKKTDFTDNHIHGTYPVLTAGISPRAGYLTGNLYGYISFTIK